MANAATKVLGSVANKFANGVKNVKNAVSALTTSAANKAEFDRNLNIAQYEGIVQKLQIRKRGKKRKKRGFSRV